MAHSIPWDWRVSLYTWTKGIAAGVYLVASLLVLFGFLSWNSEIWLWVTPIVSGLFLAITGGLLLWVNLVGAYFAPNAIVPSM